MVEEKLAFLEEAESGLVLASGMAATSTAIMALVRSGEHIIAHADAMGAALACFMISCPAWGSRPLLWIAVIYRR